MKSRTAGLKKARPQSSKDSTFRPFPVTSPEYSGAWMDEVESQALSLMGEKLRIWRESQSRQKSASQRHHRPTEKGGHAMKNPKDGSSPKTTRPSKASSPVPAFEVTAPYGSDLWMDEVWTRATIEALEEARSPFEGRSFSRRKPGDPGLFTSRENAPKSGKFKGMSIIEQMNHPDNLAKFRAEIEEGRAELGRWSALSPEEKETEVYFRTIEIMEGWDDHCLEFGSRAPDQAKTYWTNRAREWRANAAKAKWKAEATRRHAARQKIIDKLLKDAHRR